MSDKPNLTMNQERLDSLMFGCVTIITVILLFVLLAFVAAGLVWGVKNPVPPTISPRQLQATIEVLQTQVAPRR